MKTIYDFNFQVDEKLMNIINDIDRLNEQWSIVGYYKDKSIKQQKELQNSSAIRSSGSSVRIEGSKIAQEKVEILLSHFDSATLNDKDTQETAGYFETLNTIINSYKNIQVSENSIKTLHKSLMKYCNIDEKHRGNYKTRRTAVEVVFPSGIKQTIFRTAEAGTTTQNSIKRLVSWYNKENDFHPLIKNATFVYEFLNVHPFQEGNGHLSRLLSTLFFLKDGHQWMQYVGFEHEIESRKNEYYIVLQNCQNQRPNENITDWIIFFLNIIRNVQSRLIRPLEQKGDGLSVTHREQSILSIIQNNQGIQSPEIAKQIGISIPSVRRSLIVMQTKGLIKKYGSGSSTTYWTRQV